MWLVIFEAVIGALGIWVIWLTVRCPFGFHGDTMAEQVFDDNGKRVPFTMQWRCRRCMHLLAETRNTVLRPHVPLVTALYRDKKQQQGRVLAMRRRA